MHIKQARMGLSTTAVTSISRLAVLTAHLLAHLVNLELIRHRKLQTASAAVDFDGKNSTLHSPSPRHVYLPLTHKVLQKCLSVHTPPSPLKKRHFLVYEKRSLPQHIFLSSYLYCVMCKLSTQVARCILCIFTFIPCDV